MLSASLLLLLVAASAAPVVRSEHEQLGCGRLYYRTLYLDERRQALYVGAMDRLMRLDARNVSSADCERDSMHLEANNVANCVSRGKSRDYDCRNHIRVIQPIGDSRLYVCGTNGHSPKDQVVHSNLTKLSRHEFFPGIGDGTAKCPFDPDDNSTAIWVESGNPGGHAAIYSGTNAEFTKADTVIFRGDIFDASTGRREFSFKRTIKYDSHMLDKPDFVGSFDVGEHVYFFFREMAVEVMNCGRAVFSRVARVCKGDAGGENVLHQNWATFLKARLNCSIPGEFPFFFDEVQDVYKPDYDDSVFHAVFATSANGLRGSAICSFRLDDVAAAFEGKFKEQATSTSMWLPVPSASVPEPRPGSCVKDTRSLPDNVLNFIRKHPLMDGDVAHDGSGPPAFYARDVAFTKIVVDRVVVVPTASGRYGKSTRDFTVYFAGTADGKVYKVARWASEKSGGGRFESRLLDVIDATGGSGEPVRAMALSSRNKLLYVTSDSLIKQLRLGELCSRHENCVQCAFDPYCGWNPETAGCQASDGVGGGRRQLLVGDDGLCEASTAPRKLTASFGSSLHLDCKARTLEGGTVTWHHRLHSDGKGGRKVVASRKHVFTQGNGLVLIGVSEVDAGGYSCKLDGQTASSYEVAVDLGRCAAPNKTVDYQKAYSSWCNEFQQYKNALKTWTDKRSKCPSKDVLLYREQHSSPRY